MIATVFMFFFITLAAFALSFAVFFSINYARNAGIRFQDTSGRTLPGSMGGGKSLNYSKTRGKEAGFEFSFTPEALREGLKAKDKKIITQFVILTGFVTFVLSVFAAIGCGLLGSGEYLIGIIFCVVPIIFGAVFVYQLLFGRSPDKTLD
ncbi:MAG TPA: hypothetical protein P5123_05150 [Spirochaetota bacterium]|nr:hypothetical protein [Spirochaetota bacterium]